MRLLCFASLLLLPLLPATLPAQDSAAAELARAARHSTAEWLQIAPHLPDLSTASPQQLTLEGDILRARRFEEDALEFYQAALRRGGEEGPLLNRIGITELVLRHPELARANFRRVLQLRPADAQVWNNLGAAEYFLGNYRGALSGYGRALKLDRASALYHANLGTAYFELKDYGRAGKEFSTASRLDPHIFEHADSGGVNARMMTTTERGRFCFELARVAAVAHHDADVLEWLGKALDVNYDVLAEMAHTAVLDSYARDPRVRLLVSNARALHSGQTGRSAALPRLAEVRAE